MDRCIVNYPKVRGRMAEIGMSVRSLSRATGIALSTLSNKISGKTEFKASEIMRIAEVLDINNIQEYFFN